MDLQQAMLPREATILKNEWGTASGMWFNNNEKVIISLPGVPNEMKGLMRDHVLNKLQQSFHLPFIIHKTLLTYGMGESRVSGRIENWETNLPKMIKLAYLPSYGRLRLRLTAKGENKELLEKSLGEEIDKLQKIIGDILVGFDETETIEESINKLLTQRDQNLSIAESCTGGNIAKMITSVPGASNFFMGSIVTYSANIKTDVLHVSKKTIEEFTVISAEVVKEMALNCKKLFNTDYAIASTGNAGPTVDKSDKTVGVVYIAIATPDKVLIEEFNFGKPREKVILRASVKSLEMLRQEILKNT
jgi:nicotinamide-nucleotide amidase